MNRRFLLTAVTIMIAFAVADAVATSFTINELYGRTVTLVRGDERVQVFLPTASGEKPEDGMAEMIGSAPRYFGHIHVFQTPAGDRVACDHVFYWMWCDGEWRAERGEAASK